jgi:succinate dehydrogenase / fumarate reductase cytochrome b subunit
MNLLTNTFGSSLGKKYVMAVSGFALVLFVIMHLLGNLQVFLGAEVLNRYGHFLQSTPELIWPARLGLLVLISLHIGSAIQLSRENKAARPVAYAQYDPVVASYASRTMVMSGLIVLAFILYHLAHFTVQIPGLNFTGQDFRNLEDLKGRHDVYRMMVLGFQQPLVAVFYMLAIGLLCLHLSHGISSMFQSLGWRNKAYTPLLEGVAKGAAIAIFLGYASIPAAVLLGILKV